MSHSTNRDFVRNGRILKSLPLTLNSGARATHYTIEEEFAVRRYIAFDDRLRAIPAGALIEFSFVNVGPTPKLTAVRFPDGDVRYAGQNAPDALAA